MHPKVHAAFAAAYLPSRNATWTLQDDKLLSSSTHERDYDMLIESSDGNDQGSVTPLGKIVAISLSWSREWEELLQSSEDGARERFLPALPDISAAVGPYVYILRAPDDSVYVGMTSEARFRLEGHRGKPVNDKVRDHRKKWASEDWTFLGAIPAPDGTPVTVLHAMEACVNVTLQAYRSLNSNLFDHRFYCRTPVFSARQVVAFVDAVREESRRSLLPVRTDKQAWQALTAPHFRSGISTHYAYDLVVGASDYHRPASAARSHPQLAMDRRIRAPASSPAYKAIGQSNVHCGLGSHRAQHWAVGPSIFSAKVSSLSSILDPHAPALYLTSSTY